LQRENARLQRENARLQRELAEARQRATEGVEQQAATREILRVIATSPLDLQQVLDAVAEKAARLCDADLGFIYRVEGSVLRRVVAVGGSAELLGEARPTRSFPSGRAIVDKRTVHVHDLATVSETGFPDARARFR